MCCCNTWLTVLVHPHLTPPKVAVTAYDIITLRIPHNQLLVRYIHRIEFVNVECLTCTATSCTESNLAQTSNLSHNIGSVCCRYYIYFIVTPVCETQASLFSQFSLQ